MNDWKDKEMTAKSTSLETQPHRNPSLGDALAVLDGTTKQAPPPGATRPRAERRAAKNSERTPLGDILSAVYAGDAGAMHQAIARALDAGALQPANLAFGKTDLGHPIGMASVLTHARHQGGRRDFTALAVLCGWEVMQKTGRLGQAQAEIAGGACAEKSMLHAAVTSLQSIFMGAGFDASRDLIELHRIPQPEPAPGAAPGAGVARIAFMLNASVAWPGQILEAGTAAPLPWDDSPVELARLRMGAHGYAEVSEESFYDDERSTYFATGVLHVSAQAAALDAFIGKRPSMLQASRDIARAVGDADALKLHLARGEQVDPHLHCWKNPVRALTEVCRSHNEQSLRILLDAKANPDAAPDEMECPMSLVMSSWGGPRAFVHGNEAAQALALRCLQLLVSAGADPNGAGDEKNERIVHKAVRLDHPALVHFLLQNGADPHLSGPDGLDAFGLCARGVADGRGGAGVMAVLDSWRARQAIDAMGVHKAGGPPAH